MQLTFVTNKVYDLQFAFSEKQKKRMQESYKILKPVLNYSKQEYQTSWNIINDEFSSMVETITERTWKHKKYFCVVSVESKGISNWDGSNKIIRTWNEHPYGMRRITAHELILHHHFRILNEEYSDEHLSDKEKWALSEIAAFALTGLTKEANKFWPWDKPYFYDLNHNYSSIVSLQKKLKQPFLQRKSYNTYIKTGIQLLKKNSHEIDFN